MDREQGMIVKHPGRPLQEVAATPAALAVLLFILLLPGAGATLPSPAAAAPNNGDEEGAILQILRQTLALASPAFAARLPGWWSGNPSHHCRWAGVTCNTAGRVVRLRCPSQGKAVQCPLLAPGRWCPCCNLIHPSNIGESLSPLGGTSSSSSSSHGSSSSSDGGGSSGGDAAAGGGGAAVPAELALPAELARLQWLHELEFIDFEDSQDSRLKPGLPAEWMASPHAFPRLERLVLSVLQTTLVPQPLPDVVPGALPRLTYLELNFPLLRSALPGSWGGSPVVLPALEELDMVLHVVGQLPGSWAHGFRRLRRLSILETRGPGEVAMQAAGQKGARRLPNEWAVLQGAFPHLQWLAVKSFGLEGPFPPAWAHGGLPELMELDLEANLLTGPLPAQIFASHPLLNRLTLASNMFTGSLPEEWAATQAAVIQLTSNAGLQGPALPPAWARPGSMQSLKLLDLERNARLGGTLPDALPWPRLELLFLSGTGISGSIPAGWCNTSAAPVLLQRLYIRRTAVDPTLPDCSSAAGKRGGSSGSSWINVLDVRGPENSDERRPGHAAVLQDDEFTAEQQAPAEDLRHTQGTWLKRVLLPCVAAAVAAAGAAGLLLMRGQQPGVAGLANLLGLGRPQHEGGGSRAHSVLLGSISSSARDSAATGGDGGSSGGGGGGSTTACNMPADSKQARLAVMLNAAFGRGGGGGSQEAVPLLLLLLQEDSAAPLVHKFSDRGEEAEGEASHSGAVSSEADRLLPHGASHKASTAEWVAAHAGAGWPTSSSTGAPDGEHGGSPGGSRALASLRQHARDAWSLRVPPSSLTLSRDRQGELVVLGQGSQAMVCLGRLQGVEVAVKVYELPGPLDLRAVWREASLLRRCVHDRIVPLYGVACQGQVLLLAMQLMPGGSLKAALGCPDTRRRLRWREGGRQVAVDVAEGLAYLHSQHGLMHSDLKPSNVLLSADLRASLCDLGMAQAVGSQAASAAGLSCMYAAPEQLMGQRCTVAADMYSFGMLITVLATQQVGERRFQWRLPRAPEECPEAALQLIQECVSADPACRPTAAEALRRLRQPDAV